MLLHGCGDNEDSDDIVDDQWAARTLLRMRSYIQSHFVAPLRERGCPYVMVGGDRVVTFREQYVNAGQPGAKNRKEHYHHPRALMYMIEALDKIQKNIGNDR